MAPDLLPVDHVLEHLKRPRRIGVLEGRPLVGNLRAARQEADGGVPDGPVRLRTETGDGAEHGAELHSGIGPVGRGEGRGVDEDGRVEAHAEEALELAVGDVLGDVLDEGLGGGLGPLDCAEMPVCFVDGGVLVYDVVVVCLYIALMVEIF